MGRTRAAYEARFRALLRQVQPRRLELGVHLLLERAERLSEREHIALPRALAQVYERTRQQVDRGLAVLGRCSRAAPAANANEAEQRVSVEPGAARPGENSSTHDETKLAPIEFVCDAGLGGLARWLRAVGYEAHWRPEIDDDDLIREARHIPATLLTTDSLLMERGVLRDGFIPALWVPPSLKKFEQLSLVLRELHLPVRDPRCMSCGGELRPVEKESVRDRIPPKTFRWRDEYFLCTRCDKLFWHGTHWERIGNQIHTLMG